MRPRKNISLKFWAALLVVSAQAFLFHSLASAGEIVVVANSSVQTDAISADDLKRIYLRETNSLADGTHVEPVLRNSGAAHDSFLKEFLDTNDEALRTYYRTLVFTGRGSMPRTFNSDAEIVAYVGKTRGSIGYVSGGTSTEGVKILTITRPESSVRRRLIVRIEPEYPDTLKRLGIGGTVRLQVTIAAKGDVEKVELLGGNPILGESAIAAVKHWVYAPGPSRSVAEVSIPFDSHR
jgi:TonB family protein